MSNKPVDREKKATEEQVFYNLMRIVQEYPQYSIAQHLWHVLRTKGEGEGPYHWTDKTLLKKFEDYKDELDQELKTQELEQTQS